MIFPQFTIVNDFILVNKEINFLNKELIKKKFGSFSAYEIAENHFHIEDICSVSINEQIQILFLLKENWKQILVQEFPGTKFCIALYCDFKRKINTIIRVSIFREEEIDRYNDNTVIQTTDIGIYVEKFG